ncbi:MAG: bifunctional phosphoglucose/phosphomannose isomerase [Chloroflexota bacterium]
MTTEVDRTLDDVIAVARRDPGRMLDKIGRFGDQLDSGWKLSRALQLPERFNGAKAVAVLGMGGSAVCADIVRATFSDRVRVPIVSVRDYELPAWVDGDTLVIAISHSGATEETITALGTALEARRPVAVITTGGPIGEVAARVNLPRLVYLNETPPRASLGYTMSLLAGLLERNGMLDLTETEVAAAAEATRVVARASGAELETSSNMAKQLAWSLLDRWPIVEGAGFLAAVARRWKTQLNENSNSIATAEELPEATHNTVVGYEQPETLRDHQFYVYLESTLDNPRNRRRARLSKDMLDTFGTTHQNVLFDQDSRLSQACAAIALGDYVSFYLALLYGVDPSATPALTLVKDTMAVFGDPDSDSDTDAETD